ncbi:response regulator [Sphingobacterium alkalisoli]|uniref:histidine kinase n=1 Tax=Sphingobacterium alkalisoli TaxID=1874115 RepID=A0A4U0H1R0_9SPHI|nr:substrate-binding domain-containing protein [Sphingobacterium alkalisoli]TJY65515.1 response regulator [Sphingobacterium alkalisoli]
MPQKSQNNVYCLIKSRRGMFKFSAICWLIVLLLISSCGQRQDQSKFVIAFSQCVGDDAWRKTMFDEMKRALSFYPDIEFVYRDAQGNNQNQIQQIRELLHENIDLLIVSPNEAEPLTPIVDSVFQMNIPVVVTDRKTSSGLYNAYVGADNTSIGRLAAQYTAQVLQNKGHIGIVTGLKGSSASIEREKGFREYLASTPLMHISIQLQGDWEKQRAYLQAKKHLDALLATDIILAFNDQMALGVKQALRESGSDEIPIIGVDALPGPGNGLEHITEGTLFASMLYPTGGTEAIRTAVAILEKNPYKRENILGTLVIDNENAGLMALQSDKIQEQQKDIDKRQELIVEQNRIYRSQKTTLNIVVASLVLAVVFGGISIIVIKSNWEKNKHLEVQNKEILSQQQRIMEMNLRIQEASEAKTNFFTNVSHEFKTPLTLILAPLEELEKETQLSREASEQLTRIRRNAKKLQHLVSNLIDIHRIDKATIKLQASPVQIDPFIQQTLANFKPLSQQQRISLSYTNKTIIKEIWIDEYLMEQVLSNLLSNAFKFTSIGGKISIVVDEDSLTGQLNIHVVDNGVGIPSSAIEHIFDAFYQGVQSPLGSGIGLAYVKEIVALHHGQITVDSKQDMGSSFTLSLPTGRAHLCDEEIKMGSEPVATYQPNKEDAADSTAELFDEKAASFHSSKSANILIIEDDSDVRHFLNTILDKEYNVLFAKNYADALTKIERSYPDLIISDIMLPDGSGFELLKQVKNNPHTAQIPVLLLSALDTDEAKVEGMELMADAYLTKPFHVAHLKAVIANLILSRKHLKERYTSVITSTDIVSGSGYTEQDKRFLQHLTTVVESRLGDQRLNVEEIASELNMSRVQLYRKTKNLLNCSVNDYLLQRRLQRAKHLIVEGLNINEIADKIGFSSPAYFTAAFKKQFGITPTAFKKTAIKRSF